MADLSKQRDETDGFKPEDVLINQTINLLSGENREGKTKLKGER